MNNQEKSPIGFRPWEGTRDSLKAEAEKRNVSVNWLMNHIIAEWLKENKNGV